MRNRSKSLLALGLTFAAGCLVGIVIGGTNPGWFREYRKAPGPERAVAHLTEELDLTPEQQIKVKEIFARLHPEFLKEIEQARAFHRAFLLRHFQEMEPILNAKQKEKARAFIERKLARSLPPPPDSETAQ